MTETKANQGAVFYDGACKLCRAFAGRCRAPLERRGFEVLPFQAPGARERLGMGAAATIDEMRLITPAGETLGGAEAVLHIARYVWWARPLRWIAALPGGRSLLRRAYRWTAAHRTCAKGMYVIRNYSI